MKKPKLDEDIQDLVAVLIVEAVQAHEARDATKAKLDALIKAASKAVADLDLGCNDPLAIAIAAAKKGTR